MVSFWLNVTVGDETDTESIKLRIGEEEMKQQKSPKVIQLKIRKNWKETVYRRIYILTWIRSYDQSTAVSDVIAGITLGLTMIPQAIAYAALAQLPSQYGLYAAFMGQCEVTHQIRNYTLFSYVLLTIPIRCSTGSLIYVFFGTIREVSIGPTSLMALLTLQYTADKPPEFAIILAFLAGCVELAMGILKLGESCHRSSMRISRIDAQRAFTFRLYCFTTFCLRVALNWTQNSIAIWIFIYLFWLQTVGKNGWRMLNVNTHEW